ALLARSLFCFFSSRRRHTRCYRDWSSDVCSSDLYAVMLVGQVKNADQGTPRMQEIAAAVREGANAYLAAQFKRIAILIVVITVRSEERRVGKEGRGWGVGAAGQERMRERGSERQE